MTKNKYSLNIFSVLKQISTKNYTFYNGLSEDEKKSLQPLVVMRWLSGTNDPSQIILLNELVNPLVFNLPDDKSLLFKLMSISSSGRDQNYVWNKKQGKKVASLPQITNVIKEYYKYSTKHAIDVIPLMSDDTLLSHAEELGWQVTEIKELKKEFKRRKK